MESQLQKTHHVHGHHYDEHDALTHATGHDHNEDEHHEKRSVIKKVKEKAKKLKNKITHHGHDNEEDDDDDDETVEDPEVHGAPIHPDKWRGKVGKPTGMEENPFATNPTRVDTPIHASGPKHGIGMKHVSSDPVSIHGHQGHDAHKGELKGILKKLTAIPDPHAPKDPYSEKISTSASAIADKAAAAKDVIASKLGYSGQNQPIGGHETDKSGKEVDLSKMQHSFDNMGIGSNPKSYDPNHPENLPRTLTPVYEKVVDAGSTVISKVQGTVSGTGSGAETGTVRPQVHHGGSGAVAMDEGQGADKGVSVKEYLVETLRPGDEDKALSDVISHALHRGHEEEFEKKSIQDRPMGIVTESVEVRRRLGTDRHEEHQQQHSGDVIADKPVSERLRDAVGSWFGGKGDAPQGTLGTSYVTDHGLSSNPRGDQKRLSGVVPHQMGNLSSLRVLDLSGTELVIDDFTWVSRLLSLKYLDLGGILDLSLNSFEGQMPVVLQNLTSLRLLDLSRNQLNSSIPAAFKNLVELNLARNRFSRVQDIGVLRLCRLKRLDLSFNYIEKGLYGPFECTRCGLDTLVLSNNKLRGKIPTSLDMFTTLKRLDLLGNMFTGTIPELLGNLTRLIELDLSSNQLTGSIPKSLGKLSMLKKLDLSDNLLNGTISLSMGRQSRLEFVYLHDNLFSSISPSLGNLSQLRFLDQSSNLLQGPLPDSTGQLSKLEFLDVYRNHTSLFQQLVSNGWKYLKLLPVGHVPSFFQIMKGASREYITPIVYLTNMYLSRNNLVGEIPEELTFLKGLFGLNLSNNHLTGRIPDRIGHMKSLISLDVSGNHLSGDRYQLALNFTLIDPSIYIPGNDNLCGSPLTKRCSTSDEASVTKEDENNDDEEVSKWVYSIASGFITGFLATLGLVSKKLYTN
nr:low-temperature-induced 65 kDa protein-like [Tanacetum cinerariifolium]